MRHTSVMGVVAALLVHTACAAVQNSTFYRVTPFNYSGQLANMDTGDIPGDCYFAVTELSLPYWCPENPNWFACKTRSILDQPEYNVYEAHEVEHDTRFGAYSMCNPNTKTGKFECISGIEKPSPLLPANYCWYDNPQWARAFAGLCSRAECYCDAITEKAVGLLPLKFQIHYPPMDGTPSCAVNPTFNSTTLVSPTKVVENVSDAECCDLLTKLGRSHPLPPAAWASYDAATRVCSFSTEFHAERKRAAPSSTVFLSLFRGTLNGTAVSYTKRNALLGIRTAGKWYSTRAEGECAPGQRVGDGCWWRDHGVSRTVNASCLVHNLVKAVYVNHPQCWETHCASQPFNATSECSVNCFLNTALGLDGTRTVGPGLPSQDICRGFYTSFRYKDPSMLGCPDETRPPVAA